MANETNRLAPETLDGWAALHEFFRIDRNRWKSCSDPKAVLQEATAFLEKISKPDEGESACFSILGHKADLLFVHFRKSFDELNQVELEFSKTRLAGMLTETTSYVSVVELGLYEMTMKLTGELKSDGLEPDSDAWKDRWQKEMGTQRERMKARIYPAIPKDRYMCFYPMNKKRDGQDNWYSEPMERRQQMMRDHGMIGRKYAGQVTQIISGSIGFDDWEWGVDLFAKDPLVFKKLIYEMRFDEASSRFAEFGPFYTGLRLEPADIQKLFL